MPGLSSDRLYTCPHLRLSQSNKGLYIRQIFFPDSRHHQQFIYVKKITVLLPKFQQLIDLAVR